MSEAVTRSSLSTPPGLLASLEPLLRDWLPRQRWFAGKGRPVTGFSMVAATALTTCWCAPISRSHPRGARPNNRRTAISCSSVNARPCRPGWHPR